MAIHYEPIESKCYMQGDIFQKFVELRVAFDKDNDSVIMQTTREWVIVVTQSCDLEQDFKIRNAGEENDKLLDYILLCELLTPDRLYNENGVRSDILKRIKQNNDRRYHYLQEGVLGDNKGDIPELFADFKRIIAMPSDILYRDDYTSQRLCCLSSPYIEDFADRVTHYIGRVAIPDIDMKVAVQIL